MASPSIKRQRKRRRVDTDGDPEFQVAPMVDVLLVLMLFFMAITSTEVLKKEPNLKLPDAKNATTGKEHNHEIIVNVGWNGALNLAYFTMNQITYPTAADPGLESALAAQHQHDPVAHVVIRSDRNVEYSNISDLMSACSTAGISSVTFAVLLGGTGNNDNGETPAAPVGATSN